MDSKPVLYSWQKACLKEWENARGNGIVQVVTGAGKTIMALAAVERLQQRTQGNVKVRIIVPKTFMVMQWAKSIQEYCHVDRSEIGVFYGKHKDVPDRTFMIYVIDSARYTLARHILEEIQQNDTVFLIADECHHCASPENRKIFEFLPHLSDDERRRYCSLGLSATPQTNGFSSILVPALGPLIFSYGFHDAMENQVINPCAFFNVGLDMDAKDAEQYERYSIAITKLIGFLYRRYPDLEKAQGQQFFSRLQMLAGEGGDKQADKLLGYLYRRSTLVYKAPQRLMCTISIISRLDEESRIVVFGERIDQCNDLHEQLSARYPGRVARYHSAMDESVRKQAIQQYRDGEARILVTCRALDEGFDMPVADVGIIMSGNAQQRQRIQRLGRILRRSKGKGMSSLFYLHLRQTTENDTLLDQPVPSIQEFFLYYDIAFDGFSHPVYDELASHLLTELRGEQRVLDAGRESFLRGQLRTDWLASLSYLVGKREEATTMEDKNYWTCMIAMARARGENSIEAS